MHENSSLLTAIYESAIDGIIAIDASGLVRDVNPAACTLFGYEPDEVIGENVSMLMPAPESDRHDGYIADYIATGDAKIIGKGRNVTGRRKDGGLFPFHLSVSAFEHEGKMMFVGFVHDLTELTRVTNKLEENETMLRRSLEFANVGAWSRDLATNVLTWSEQIPALLGYPPAELETTYENFLNAVHPDDRDLVVETLSNSIANGTVYNVQHRVVWPDGTVRWLEEDGNVERDSNGTPVRVLGVVQDITDIKEFEKMLRDREEELKLRVIEVEGSREAFEAQAAEMVGLAEDQALLRERAEMAELAKADFLASMSHEIRTPMTGVMGMADLLLKGELSQTQRDYALAIKSSAFALLEIINDILDQSKLDAGKIELEERDFSLPALISDISKIVEPRIAEKDVALNTDIAPEVPKGLRGDATRLRQVVINLLGNAIKFTEKGSVSVRVAVNKQDDGDMLRFAIDDTGIGISEEAQARLFMRFEQADKSTTRQFGGSGLGLSISKQLVEMMGGTIGVESTLTKGSTFWFEVPLRTAKKPLTETGSEFVPAALTAKRPVSILVAEDNKLNQLLIQKLIGDMGHNLIFAENGEDAVACHDEGAFELILMDIRMPVMDGIEATRQIRARPDEKANIPIIALTADVTKEHVEDFLAAGMNEVSGKPFDLADLTRKIDIVLGEDIHARATRAKKEHAVSGAGAASV